MRDPESHQNFTGKFVMILYNLGSSLIRSKIV
jgi:hypothetical protein